jgi:hypothetical protein
MTARIIDISGQRFGRLTVLALHPERERYGTHYVFALWHCLCDCGAERIARGNHLRGGKVTSCGCLQRERVTKHGMHGTPTYESWHSMKRRCFCRRPNAYPHYAGRGITVEEVWLDFKNFYADMGDRPDGQTLDRIDPNSNYGPGKCRWATPLVQARNKRRSLWQYPKRRHSKRRTKEKFTEGAK